MLIHQTVLIKVSVVKEIKDHSPINITKWVVQKVDLSKHNECLDKERKIKELEK